jgi:RecA-family ATPase
VNTVGEEKEIKRFLYIREAFGDNITFYADRSIPDLIDQLAEELEHCSQPPLVIIDTLGKAVTVSDINDYAKVNRMITPFIETAMKTGIHLMLLHHANKNTGAEGIDISLGSSAITGAVDTVLTLTRKDNYRLIRSDQRYGEALPETLIVYDPGNRTLTKLGEAKAYEHSQIEGKITAVLRKHEKGLPADDISRLAEVRAEKGRAVLNDMVERGKVTCKGAGKRNDPKLYQLKAEEKVRAA